MKTYYIYAENGELTPISCASLPTGRYQYHDGKLVQVSEKARGPACYGRDDLGLKGVLNPVDGKRYDSKSEYYKAIKASGHIVLGTDAKTEVKRDQRGNYDCKADIKKAMDQTGFSNRKSKGKKR